MTKDPGASSLTPTHAVSEPLLRLVSVGHVHGAAPWLFRDVNLSVQPGERLAIQGASGCGKSTLLQIMAGLDAPIEGEVYWGRQPMSGWSDAQRRVCRQSQMGFVFQAFHLLPHLSALQNVMVPCLLGGQSAQVAKARATELLETLGLGHRLEAKPATLSGGEQQRVALARALVHGPAVVFADEPTGNLDAASAANALDCLLDLCAQQQASLVMVTHADAAARAMDRVLQLTPEGLV